MAKVIYDHALRAEEEPREVVRYGGGNPLLAGLIRHIADYPS